ncbi:GMC family oxidoreductase N-terminal domain-containing protein, partial [Alphaproteobacteria bacterium]|nr:GMC family oxidoreductase N-terminal domain-containing protein [Alphaproteobacteria bacterium]
QRGNRGWGYADILPYFKKCEQRIGAGDDTFRGRVGKLQVTDLNYKHPLCEAFMEGAGELGIPRNQDYNGALQEGISYVQRTTYRRRRVSTARAFLNPAKKRSNLKVVTNAFVTRILLNNKTAHGVEFSKGGQGGELSKVSAKKRGYFIGRDNKLSSTSSAIGYWRGSALKIFGNRNCPRTSWCRGEFT